jgi:hypothetical protein
MCRSKINLYSRCKKDQVLIKHEAVKALGYLCEIWVYENKGNRLEVIS